MSADLGFPRAAKKKAAGDGPRGLRTEVARKNLISWRGHP